jgi:hypothetical protein
VIEAILKYPRTQHIAGSRLQHGDEDLDAVPIGELAGEYVVVEEKIDGANSGISVSPEGELRLQSRGHYLTGGKREKHFTLLKQWASAHASAFRELLGQRYLVYGEWVYAKHTIFYDQLPHYFLEFDVYDKQTEEFLSTERRHRMFEGSPIVSVPVLRDGAIETVDELRGLIGRSLYKSDAWYGNLERVALSEGIDPDRARRETDPSDDAEGLYLKVEAEGRVTGRYKFVRASFLTSVIDSGSHWLDRPIVPNQLADGVDLFAV